ncbi:DUF4249 domain-containing protein [Spirosoma foliorum]|uniref:DUF4249 domain-containing protein n=1 Tax=Spirosoma foliorum TaxID=2710596 RepID=A0A7G5GMX6_9BACT|nr:DUF4249 domain-containing protein [Spirosoma foliorum]QMW00218.1 DUF4249 domain-containing protein [Spirosoma foliorum]
MRVLVIAGFIFLNSLLLTACVDRLDINLPQHTNIIVVDGILNNLPEPQLIQLNRAQTDSVTGRAGFKAITKATVEVIVDSTQVITCHETIDGRYQLPSDFRGKVGHTYQLHFKLSDGKQYLSTKQLMQPVPPIDKVTLRFSLTSLPANTGLLEEFRSGFDVVVDVQDPANQRNYYRWDWSLYEKQDWCQSCNRGYYMTNQLKMVSSYPNILIYQTQPEPSESCFEAPSPSLFGGNYTSLPVFFINSYVCRTQCWDIIPNSKINLFSDAYSNGGLIASRNVGQIPYYTENPALAEIRQSSLTADAYRYFSSVQEQTQNTGGLADGQPAALVGNVHNTANPQEKVIGYFTVGAISSVRYWLDKKDATGIAYGGTYYDPGPKVTFPVPGEQQLFFAFHRALPTVEAYLNFTILGGGIRPPTALCVPSDSRTPNRPEGWRD